MNLKPEDFKEIGIAVHRIYPRETAALIRHLRSVKAQENDIKKIPEFFSKFCVYKNIDGINSKTHTKTEYVYLRYVFMAAIIKMYNPELLSPIHQFRMRRDLRINLARVFKTQPAWVSQSISTVCMHMKIYPAFKDDVIKTLGVIRKP